MATDLRLHMAMPGAVMTFCHRRLVASSFRASEVSERHVVRRPADLVAWALVTCQHCRARMAAREARRAA